MSSDPEFREIQALLNKGSAVLLPCEPAQFRDFISGLLGRPQTVGRFRSEPFDLRREDIETLYHLINQRVQQQNDATLVQFVVQLTHHDNSTVTLNSFDDFIAYNEVRPLRTNGVNLGWTFLVQFRDRKFPEKQNIDITFDRTGNSRQFLRETGDHHFLLMTTEERGVGVVSLQIRHTARTWATDIDALVTGQLEMFLKVRSAIQRRLNKWSDGLGLLSGGSFLLASLFFAAQTTVYYNRVKAAAVEHYFTQPAASITELGTRLDTLYVVLIKDKISGFVPYGLLFLVAAFVVSIAVGTAVGLAAGASPKSLIILTKADLRAAEKEYSRRKLLWAKLMASIAGSIATGVIGNLLYDWCFRSFSLTLQ
jgi:hypothetical protein